MNRPSYRRKRRRNMRPAIWLIVAATVILLLAQYGLARDRNSRHVDVDGDLTAVVTAPSLTEEIIEYTGMTVSFNRDEHIPNWVAYELTADEAQGEEPRGNRFAPDTAVSGCATPDDYKHTGFDRGHLAPAADMKWSPQAMQESFLMTNIAPQVQSLNRGSWGKLEEKVRKRAMIDSAVIVVAGPVLSQPPLAHIGTTSVTVPAAFFKVVLSPYADPPTAIGFIFPNGTIIGGMQSCAVTVDSVESLTGHDFFSALPDDIEEQVESQVNFHRWSRMQ